MAQQNMKAKTLMKDTVVLLIDLISKKTIITTKATNASSNKMKEEAWAKIAEEFSALTGEIRRPEQLRSKWENLKKAARKRCALIRQNNIKTGGGKSFIPPDEVLDRVATMLGATCSGYSVEFGGDSVAFDADVDLPGSAVVDILQYMPEHPPTQSSGSDVELVGETEVSVATSTPPVLPPKFTFNASKNSCNLANKRRKLSDELLKSQTEKEKALAAYLQARTEKIKLENIKLEIEINILKQNQNG